MSVAFPIVTGKSRIKWRLNYGSDYRSTPGSFLALIALLTATGLALIGQAGADDGDSLPAPSELQASTERGSLDVTLDWDDVDGAASYLVRWRVADPAQAERRHQVAVLGRGHHCRELWGVGRARASLRRFRLRRARRD